MSEGNAAARLRQSRLFSRLITFTAVFVVFVLVFLGMFQMFESISMQAMLRMNQEFSAQASTISDSMQSIIDTVGTQMFYISSTAKLRKSTGMTNNERVFALRELWQYAMAGSMLHSIYVFNQKLNMVYTTDNDYSSGSMETFYDQDAVALYRSRSAENRMKLRHRIFHNTSDYPTQTELYSYLIFEVTANGDVGESAVMLNLDAQWFQESLLNFPGENYIIISQDGYVVASQSERLNGHSLGLLSRIQNRKSGYLMDRLDGERTICFFSPLETNGWYCLRYVSYAECLPGLSRIRSGAWVALSVLAVLLMLAAMVALIRLYDPYHRMADMLRQAPESEDGLQAADRLERMVASSWSRQREDALRLWITGQPGPENVPAPVLPAFLLMAEHLPDEAFRSLLNREAPEAILAQQEDVSLALCAFADTDTAAEICLHLSSQLQCRCYYSPSADRLEQLPERYQALLECRRLRFFYPGQQVFFAPLPEETSGDPQLWETALTACISSAQTDKHLAFSQLMEKLKGESFENVLFALKRLDQMLEAALPPSEQPAVPLENLLASAQEPGTVSGYFLPRLEALSLQQQEQKRSRGREAAAQINLRLEQGFRDTGMSAQTIAEEMGLSAAYLRKQYLNETGLSIGDKLNQLRVDEACRLLRETDLSVEAIARQIGVENTKYFFVLFKKIKGVTPRQFRMLREGEEL